MKKTWIKLKRGILAPKHRDKLGIRIWLYLYILDQVDWETGKILEWRDKQAAEDLQMPWRTLQQQRQKLAEDGYIANIQKGDKQVITVLKWTNPREYSGEVYNPTGRGTESQVPADGDTQSSVPPEGTNEGTNEGVSKPSTLPIRSHITDHTAVFGRWCSVYESEIGGLTGMIGEEIEELVGEYPDQWFEDAVKIAAENNIRKLSYVKGIMSNWKIKGRGNGKGKTKEQFVEWS
jgi:DnaD/phage-associated family protein